MGFAAFAVQIDEGCVRLATANALLKLAKSQENPVSADVYIQLALTMQVGRTWLCIVCFDMHLKI